MCGAVRNGLTRGPGRRWFQALESLALIATAPFIEQSPRDSKEPKGPADIAADLFIVLQHAEAGGRTPGSLSIPMLLLIPDLLSPGPIRGLVLSGHHPNS